MTAPKKSVPMCHVTIGYRGYLLPVDKGMKLVELMQSAFQSDKNYEAVGYNYSIGEQPEVEFCLVKPSQIKQKATNANGQLLIGAK